MAIANGWRQMVVTVAVFLILGGCSTQVVHAPQSADGAPASPTSGEADRPQQNAEKRPNERSEDRTGPAVQRLITKADLLLSEGQYQSAIDTAERGLRVDRYTADLYRVLAEAYSLMGSPEQATSFAQLGLRYVGTNSELRRRLDAFIRR